ncbi:MAG TPA: biotin synthase BioB [Desulfosalsimonadaceae bacterium]|nr:biotin synthase BioB [Desulfosalsimonadaceae bacterium]
MLPFHLSTPANKATKNPSPAISREEALRLAELAPGEIPDLLYAAHRIARAREKTEIFTCTIINAKSGLCSQDCAFCAQSAHHETNAPVYPLLSKQELAQGALEAESSGARHFSMVTSGYALDEGETETICEAAQEIRRKTALAVCCSPGMLSRDQAEKFRAAGITTYHHNLETAESFYPHVCTTHPYEEDIRSLQTAADAGLVVCSGCILGLGESWQQRVELAFALSATSAARIPINFLSPIAGTKMGHRPVMEPVEALKCIALFRFINPDKDIIICGGREAALADYQSWVFAAGANALMVGNYLTTRGRGLSTDREMIRQWQHMLQPEPAETAPGCNTQ